MLRGNFGAREEQPPASTASPAQAHSDSKSSGAEQRPGPTRGTSWKEVEHISREKSPVRAAENGDSGEDLENREIRIKDLDTGREFNVRKKYTITDLNTGQLFALCKDPTLDPDSPEAANAPQHVTDFASGKQLSLEEFDIALGLRRKEETQRSKAQPEVSSGSETAGDQHSVEGIGSAAGARKKSWLKRIPFRKGKVNSAKSDGSESESTVSTPQLDEGPASLNRQSGAASVSGRTPVRVHVHRKLYKDLADLCLVQSLHAHTGVVWAMKFSYNGRYLATAGQDALALVWEVAPHRGEKTSEASSPSADQPSNGHQPGSPLSPEVLSLVFKAAPHRTYRGHKQDVLDVAWSKSLFLLTASMDKTVRLWHVSMDDCLRVFRHTDFVTALDFHPIDDKHFVSGSIDGKVRIWNIPEQNGRVVDYADVHEMVTATSFSDDGTRAIVGTMKGKCRFYQCSTSFKLEYEAQIDVKNRRGKASRGRKVTGVQFLPNDSTKLLITSNDSRIRLYDGYTLRCKYKGLHNTNTQIRANFSQHGDFIICGSDDGSVYFWTTAAGTNPDSTKDLEQSGSKQEKSGAYESFHAHNDIATVAIFAPDAARRPLHRKSPRVSERVAGASESMNRLGLRSKFSKEEAADAAVAGEVAMASAKAYGQVLLTAGYDGEIKVFENLAPPHWL